MAARQPRLRRQGGPEARFDEQAQPEPFRTTDRRQRARPGLAQYPGQTRAARCELNNELRPRRVLHRRARPNLINTANFGFTNIRIKRTGTLGTSLHPRQIDVADRPHAAFARQAPTYNFIDDLTWNKGTHSLTIGGNLRIVRNDRTSYANAFPALLATAAARCSVSAPTSSTVTQAYLANLTGNPTIRLTDATNVDRALRRPLRRAHRRRRSPTATTPTASRSRSASRPCATSRATSSSSTTATTGA